MLVGLPLLALALLCCKNRFMYEHGQFKRAHLRSYQGGKKRLYAFANITLGFVGALAEEVAAPLHVEQGVVGVGFFGVHAPIEVVLALRSGLNRFGSFGEVVDVMDGQPGQLKLVYPSRHVQQGLDAVFPEQGVVTNGIGQHNEMPGKALIGD